VSESIPQPKSDKKNRYRAVLPASLFLLALILRLFGIGWGLKNDLHNQSYHPDESVVWAYSQGVNPAELKFTPGFYNYGTLYLTTLRVASDMTAVYTGAPDPKNADAVWSYVARCNLAGRIISALSGAATVLFVFLMMRRFLGDMGATAAALVILIAPAHVVHSRFQTVDIFATFLLTVSAYFALRLIPVGKEEIDPKKAMKWVLGAAIFAGLSAGTKYTGVLGLLTLLAVILMCRRPTAIKEGLIAIVVTLVAFVVATPGVLLETEKFKEGVSFEMAHTAQGHGLVFAETASGYLYHLANLMSGIGATIVWLALAGLAWAAYRKYKWAFALLAFFVPYYLLIGGATDKYMRYTFPLYVAIAAGFGYAVSAGHKKGGMGSVVVLVGIMGIGGIIDSRGLMGAARETSWMMGEDPRDAAARYLKKQADTTPNMLVGLASDPWYWSPPLFPESTCMRSVPFPQRMQLMAAAEHPKVTYYVALDGDNHPFDARLIEQTKPDYVAISSLESSFRERLSRKTGLKGEEAAAGEQYSSFMKALAENYEGDRSFGDPGDGVEDMQYVQPIVQIWKRKATAPK